MDPDILILDEPTTAQDHKGRHDIVQIAKSLNKRGKTIIMITHDMELVAEYTERTIVLGKGEIIMDGPTSNVFDQPEKLKETFLKPPQITQLAHGLKDHNIPGSIVNVDSFTKLFKPRSGK